jgi:hypothetical protein
MEAKAPELGSEVAARHLRTQRFEEECRIELGTEVGYNM